MKRLNKYIPLIVGIVICLLISTGLSLYSPKRSRPVNQVSNDIANAVELYEAAIIPFNTGDLKLTISVNAITTIGRTAYSTIGNATAFYDRSDTQNPRYHIQQEFTMGSHHVSYEDYYIDSDHYRIVSKIPFCSSQNAIKKTIPSPTLDHRLYKKISGTQTENGYRIEFSDATVAENWISSECAQLISASGTAFLSADGQLLSYDYNVIIKSGSVQNELSLQVTPEHKEVYIDLPNLDWISVTDLSAPLLLELAVGTLVQTTSISTNYKEEIYFEALGDQRIRNIVIQLDNFDTLDVDVITEISISNDSRLNQPNLVVKRETFSNGIYTIATDSNEVITDDSVNAEAMMIYLHNQLISTIMLPEYIDSYRLIDSDTTIRYHFTGNADFAEFICRNAGQQLYRDPELLSGDAVNMKNDDLICYLDVDKTTRLPIGSGISYTASYQKEGLPYHFFYEATQTYQIH